MQAVSIVQASEMTRSNMLHVRKLRPKGARDLAKATQGTRNPRPPSAQRGTLPRSD